MNLTNHLKAIGYDYLPLCHCDGETDDSRIIQMRINAGFYLFKAETPNHKAFAINKTINVPSALVIDGRHKGSTKVLHAKIFELAKQQKVAVAELYKQPV